MTNLPPSDLPPRPPGPARPAGKPGAPLGKKTAEGWQLPVDSRLLAKSRQHPAQRKRPEAKPKPVSSLFYALAYVPLFVFLAGGVWYWWVPIKTAFHQWRDGQIQEQVRPGTHSTTTATPSAALLPTLQATYPEILRHPWLFPGFPPVVVIFPGPEAHLIGTSSSPSPLKSGGAKGSSTLTLAQKGPKKTREGTPVSLHPILTDPGHPPVSGPSQPGTASTSIIAPPSGPEDSTESAAWGQTEADQNLIFAGEPRPAISDAVSEVLFNQAYAVGYSESRQDPLWVSYRLDRHAPSGALPRPGKFSPDHRTISHVSSREYSNTGYDRGHLAPNSAIAREFGPQAQLETFLMSNITPQKPDLNRKVWERLERLEEKYADEFNRLYVIDGPIFDEYRQTLSPRSDVEIPDEFYKILVQGEGGDIKMLAFRVPQTVGGNEPLDQFLTSVEDVQKATGLDFFWALADRHEKELEAEKPSGMWTLR